MICVLPSGQQPHSLKNIERSIVYSEVGQLLVSVGARHSVSSTTPETVRKTLSEEREDDIEDDDDIFPGGFVMDMEDDEHGEGVDGGRVGCGVEGKRWDKGEGGVKRKVQKGKKELNKAMSSGDLSGMCYVNLALLCLDR